jgi:hypothetical protein
MKGKHMRAIKQIIIHCSDSEFGNVVQIDRWHRERGWKGIGYHYVITNGVINHGDKYDGELDGVVQVGRPLDTIGAHCMNHNADSIGICLVGVHHFTGRQFEELVDLVGTLSVKYGIPSENVHGHREYDKGKTCPNFDVAWIRNVLMKKQGGK